MKALSKWKNEVDVKAAVKEVLAAYGTRVWYFMPAANGFGRAGIPDFIGTLDGRTFAVETKFGNNPTTVHQDREILSLQVAGAQAWVVNEKNFTEWQASFAGWVALCS